MEYGVNMECIKLGTEYIKERDMYGTIGIA